MKVKLTLSYDGTSYAGYQVQPNGITIQQKLEEALFSLYKIEITTVASGRTDAGVHALGQVVSFEAPPTVPAEKIYLAINSFLPPDIRATKSECVDDDFNARYSAKKKTYEYNLYFGEVENPILERFAVMISSKVDLEKMKECAKIFIGEHDFKCFCSSGSSVKTTVRKVYDIELNKNGENLKISVTGNGFLYNMVRILVGTLVKVGEGDLEISSVEKMLQSGDRNLGGKTFPAKGLTLKSVEY